MYHYFPESYMWSHAVLLALGTIPWGGGEIGEIDLVGKRLRDKVGDNEAWYEEWHRMAEKVEMLAEKAAKAGHNVTARETYLRACNYYHLAERFLPPQDERKLSGYKRALACFAQTASRLIPPVERVEIPYERSALPAYFVPAEGARSLRAPVVIFFDGLDVTKEQLYLIGGRELVRRGLACLIVDGPGNGEALRMRGLHLRPDYERPASAAVDYLETRSDVDPERIGIMAVSLGGYYAPRAAAFEKRLKACVAWGAIYDYHEIWQRRIEAGVRAGSPVSAPLFQIQWVLGVNSPEKALEKLRDFTLQEVAPRITCPFLVIHGEEDAQIPVADAYKLYEAVGSPYKQLKILTAAEGGTAHCQLDNIHLAHYYIFDWLADTLR